MGAPFFVCGRRIDAVVARSIISWNVPLSSAMAALAPDVSQDEILIRFEWIATKDIHVVQPVGVVRTEDHCRQWLRAFEERFRRSPERVDVVLVLDMFSTAPELLATWKTYRDAALRYVRYCIRVDAGTDAFAISKRPTVPGELTRGARTIPDAIDIILALRTYAQSQ